MMQRANFGRCQGDALSVFEGRLGRALDLTQRPTGGFNGGPSRRPELVAALNHKARWPRNKAILMFMQISSLRGDLVELVQKNFQNAEEALASYEHIDIFKRNKAVKDRKYTQAQGVHK